MRVRCGREEGGWRSHPTPTEAAVRGALAVNDSPARLSHAGSDCSRHGEAGSKCVMALLERLPLQLRRRQRRWQRHCTAFPRCSAHDATATKHETAGLSRVAHCMASNALQRNALTLQQQRQGADRPQPAAHHSDDCCRLTGSATQVTAAAPKGEECGQRLQGLQCASPASRTETSGGF